MDHKSAHKRTDAAGEACRNPRGSSAPGGQRWFHLYPHEEIRHNDVLHWTKLNQNWNFMCAECHSTGVRKNYDGTSDRFATTWAEISVGCETCHGPGSHPRANVGRARRNGNIGPPARAKPREEILGRKYLQALQLSRHGRSWVLGRCRETPKFCDRDAGGLDHKGEGCRRNLSLNENILR